MPLPNKKKREGESDFQHKIRQWTEEVKDRPGRFPGGRDQAIAIAAEQSGQSRKSIMFIDQLFGKSESKAHKDKMRVFIDEMEEEYEDASKGPITSASGSGFSTGMAIGSGLDTPGGTARPTISGARQAAGSVGDRATGQSSSAGTSRPKTAVKSHGCEKCDKGICPHHYEETAKALKAGALAIPRHMQGPYDPEHTRRSATQQTSRMYTSLAPPVEDTVKQVQAEEKSDPRINAVKSQEENSRRVQELRDRIAASFMPRDAGLKFTR